MQEQDLLHGNILKSLLAFAIPISLSMLASQCYSLADTMIIGKLLNADALAAVSNASTILMIFLFISGGMELGGSLLIASNKSKLDEKGLTGLSYNLLFLDVFIGIIMTVLGVIFFKNMLFLINTPASIVGLGNTYGMYYLIGLPFVMLYCLMQEMLIGYGDSKSPMKYVIITSVFNIILDYILIKYVKMGIAGAALATSCSQILGTVLIFGKIYHLLLKRRFYFSDLNFSYLKETVQIALPNMIQQMSGPIISMVRQSLLGMIGVAAIAGFSCANRVLNLGLIPMYGITHGLSIFVAQNYAANEPERILEAKKKTYLVTGCYAAAVAMICFIFHTSLLHLFTDDKQTIYYGAIILIYEPVTYILTALRATNEAMMKGYKKLNTYLFSNMTSTIGNTLVSALLVPMIGFNGFYIATYITSVMNVSLSSFLLKKLKV